MRHSLTQRLQTTPMLIAEIDGLMICEPLIFVPIAAAPSSGEGGRPVVGPKCGSSPATSSSGSHPGDASESANRLAGVDDFHFHEDAL